jgi:hypothetical protein
VGEAVDQAGRLPVIIYRAKAASRAISLSSAASSRESRAIADQSLQASLLVAMAALDPRYRPAVHPAQHGGYVSHDGWVLNNVKRTSPHGGGADHRSGGRSVLIAAAAQGCWPLIWPD